MRRRTAGLLVLLLLTAGCGVPRDAEPRALDPSAAPFQVYIPEAAPEPEGDRAVGVYLVRADRLERTERRIERSVTPARVLAQLLVGPTSQELTAGLTSAIPGAVEVLDIEMQADIALISVAGFQREQVRRDQLTAFAQIVATLDDLPGIEGVRFRLGDADLEVPRGDSSLTDGPLKRADYAELLAPPAPAASPGGTPPAPA